MREEFIKKFRIGKYDYEVIVTPYNEVMFHMINGIVDGREVAGIDRFGSEFSTSKQLDCVECPFSVLNEVKRVVLEFIFKNGIPFFIFTSSGLEPKRTRVYRKLCERIEKEIPYKFVEDDGYFLFYRV